MNKLRLGQRVRVRRTADGVALWQGFGAVVRLRRADDLAWIRLNKRAHDAAHPFPVDDETRSAHVLAAPEDCEPCADSFTGDYRTFEHKKDPPCR